MLEPELAADRRRREERRQRRKAELRERMQSPKKRIRGKAEPWEKRRADYLAAKEEVRGGEE